MTKVNKPRVTSKRGRLRSKRTGRRNAFNIPNKSEAPNKPPHPSNSRPETTLAATSTPSAVINQRSKNSFTESFYALPASEGNVEIFSSSHLI